MKQFTFLAFVVPIEFAFASGSSHRITLDKPALLAGTELKPGDYKLELSDDKVTISNKKTTVDAPAKLESNGGKFSTTTMCCLGDDGKYNLQEIRVGGTNQKVVITGAK